MLTSGPALLERGVGKQSCADGLQGQANACLLDHVLLAAEVNVDLQGAPGIILTSVVVHGVYGAHAEALGRACRQCGLPTWRCSRCTADAWACVACQKHWTVMQTLRPPCRCSIAGQH